MKMFLPPILLLTILLTFSLVNCSLITRQTDRWSEQLAAADACADAGDWPRAAQALEDSYRSWSSRQTYLHIVVKHEEVDGAEALYRRAAAIVQEQALSEFRAEIADLRNQLRLLAEMERVSIGNIL